MGTLLAVGTLLPFMPAYILYKTLPIRTTVKAHFKGLNIQLVAIDLNKKSIPSGQNIIKNIHKKHKEITIKEPIFIQKR